MTISSWYKCVDLDFNRVPHKMGAHKPITLTRCDQLGCRLRTILQEHDSTHGLFRKQAGVDYARQKKRNKLGNERGTSASLVPSVCKFQKIYVEHKKQLNQQTRLKVKPFHSHPVPNFKRSHKLLELKQRQRRLKSLHLTTKPQTPNTLINSMEAERRKQREIKEQSQKLDQTFIPKINREQSMAYLHRKPFVPRIESTIVQVQPFQLQSSERAKSRRQFDQNMQKLMQQRSQQIYEYWQRNNREEYLKLRKLTEFKASPNPWKRTYAKN